MKDGTTPAAYKVEFAVDLESDLIVSATMHPGNAADTATVIDTAIHAAVNLDGAGCEGDVEAVMPCPILDATRRIESMPPWAMIARPSEPLGGRGETSSEPVPTHRFC
jgi:hypothetical protein